jgi:hypothetical protein
MLGNLYDATVFIDGQKRHELIRRLNLIEGVSFPVDAIRAFPTFPRTLLTQPETLSEFLSVFDWVVEEIRQQ